MSSHPLLLSLLGVQVVCCLILSVGQITGKSYLRCPLRQPPFYFSHGKPKVSTKPIGTLWSASHGQTKSASEGIMVNAFTLITLTHGKTQVHPHKHTRAHNHRALLTHSRPLRNACGRECLVPLAGRARLAPQHQNCAVIPLAGARALFHYPVQPALAASHRAP